MKILTRLSGIAAAILFSLAGAASAGTLTIERGPSFLPGSAFTDNDIAATLLHDPPGVMGDVVRLFGDSMVEPTAAHPHVIIGGNFSANAGDLFSVLYDFTVDLNSATPVTLTLAAQTVVAGVHESFSTLVTLNPGLQHYQGQIDGPLFGLATSGLWKGRLLFNFSTPTAGAAEPEQTNLQLQLNAVDYQLAAIPEPSSLAFLALGIAALAIFALRRRQIAD